MKHPFSALLFGDIRPLLELLLPLLLLLRLARLVLQKPFGKLPPFWFGLIKALRPPPTVGPLSPSDVGDDREDGIPLQFAAAAAAFANNCLNEVVKSVDNAAAAAAAGHKLFVDVSCDVFELLVLFIVLCRAILEHMCEFGVVLLVDELFVINWPALAKELIDSLPVKLLRPRLNLEAHISGNMFAVFTSMAKVDKYCTWRKRMILGVMILD